MTRFAAVLVFLISLMGGVCAAFAFSSQTGTSVSGVSANIADPDEQTPPFLGTPGSRASSSYNLNASDPEGQGYMSRDNIQQSTVRGDGSYLNPNSDSQK